jgi:YD repeat-containing protein
MKRLFLLIAIVISVLLCFSASPYATAGTVNYTYDDAGRLIKVDYGDGKTIEYTYDKAGNLLQRAVTAPESDTDGGGGGGGDGVCFIGTVANGPEKEILDIR